MVKERNMLKRKFLLMLLAFTTLLTISVYADNAGSGSTVGGIVGKGNNPTTTGWGIRLSIGTSAQVSYDESIGTLSLTASNDDLYSMYKKLSGLSSRTYIKPGVGFVQWTTGSHPDGESVDDAEAGVFRKRERIISGDNADTEKLNYLAWMIYNPPWESDDRSIPYSDLMFNIISNPGQYGDAVRWGDTIHTQYIGLVGQEYNAKETVQKVLYGCTSEYARRWGKFSWSAFDQSGGNDGTPQQRVEWSKIGHLTSCLYLAFAAKEMGDVRSYEDMISTIYAWAMDGYKGSELQPIVVAESTSTVGGKNGKWYNMTLPMQITASYPSVSPGMLFSKWDRDYTSTNDALLQFIGGTSCRDTTRGMLKQGISGYFQGGKFNYNVKTSYAGRGYLMSLKPNGDNPGLYGYVHSFTYLTDYPLFAGATSSTDGKFTWDLDPKGVIDKSPDKNVTEAMQSEYVANIHDVNGTGHPCDARQSRTDV